MERQLLIADADSFLSDIYRTYFTAHGYSVRVTAGGVECLTALRETTPDVLVLDTELKWGGADGVLAVMDEEERLASVPVVLLNDVHGQAPPPPRLRIKSCQRCSQPEMDGSDFDPVTERQPQQTAAGGAGC